MARSSSVVSSATLGNRTNLPLRESGVVAPKPRYLVQLTFNQLLITWAVIFSTMAAVFFFGLAAGQRRGIDIALRTNAVEAVRLPLTEEFTATAGISDVDGGANPVENITANLETTKNNVESEAQKLIAEEVVIDFSSATKPIEKVNINSAPINSQTSGVAAGVAAKPVLELVKQNDSKPVEAVGSKGAASKTNENLNFKEEPKIDITKMKQVGGEGSQKSLTDTPTPTAKGATEPKVVPAVKKKPVTDKALLPAKAKTLTPLPPGNLPVSRVSPGWYVQLAALGSINEANGLLQKAKNNGFGGGSIQEAKVGGKTYYRVLIGPYKDRGPAENHQKQIRNMSLAHGTPFLKFIN